MHSRINSAIYGAIGGVTGAACMTVLRLAAQRSSGIDMMVPQAVTERLAEAAGIDAPGGHGGQQATIQALHLGYGFLWGGLYGLIFGKGQPAGWLGTGALYGLGLWVLGFFGLVPLMDAARPAWRTRPAENTVNIGAHLLYGAVTAFVLEQVARQPAHYPGSRLLRKIIKVG